MSDLFDALCLSLIHIYLARVKVTKKDKNSKVNLSGAVFGIYSDSACKNLLVQMPVSYTHLDVYKRQQILCIGISLQKSEMKEPDRSLG